MKGIAMKSAIAFLTLLVVLAGTASQAAVVTETVAYTHDGVQLEGYLAYDDAVAGKRPAVLVVHEWWGLNDYARKRAEQLAGLGYVAFALDMYGKGKVTTHPDQAGQWARENTANVEHWRQRALSGLTVLKRHPRTDPTRVAAIGYCFGGATVQQLAYAGADLRGVVSFHGSLLPPPVDPEAGKIKAGILICHGAADPLVPADKVQAYLAAMGASGLDWQMIFYGGAKHSFTNPDADKAGMAPLGYHPVADKSSWAAMQAFFDRLFTS
jgi:dienelactone hydrolase